MTFDEEYVRGVLASFWDRCETVKMAGGIPLLDVVDRTAEVPKGWVLDHDTQYYIPPHLILDKRETNGCGKKGTELGTGRQRGRDTWHGPGHYDLGKNTRLGHSTVANDPDRQW